MGNRRKHLLGALKALRGCQVISSSRLYETSPVGPSIRPYLNLAVKISTTRSPIGLLVELKRLEALAGRKPGPRWGPRPLDIDIIAFGNLRLRTPWLIVPHPRVSERAFALAPLSEIAPNWRPTGHDTVGALLKRLNPAPGTVKIFSDA